MVEAKEDFPLEITEQVQDFHNNLQNLVKILDPILKNYHQLKKVASQDTDNLTSFELTICYTINSLFWMYLQTNGVDSKQHSIKTELERIKQYFNRLKEIKEFKLKPKLNKTASSAFVRNALFDVKSRQKKSDEELKENPSKRFKKK